MAITKIHPIKSTLKQALAYVIKADKTEDGTLVSSFACAPETADIEFSFTLSHCIEKGNNLAFHLIQSFKPGETDPNTAHRIGESLAIALLKGKHEYVLGTHVDKGHIHNHLIFCAANFEDYRKFVSNRKSYYYIRKLSDRLCKEAGLSVIDPGDDRGKTYKEHMSLRLGESWKEKLKALIITFSKTSKTYEEFLLKMHISGYEINDENRLMFRPIGEKHFIYASSLGYRFSDQKIRSMINKSETSMYMCRRKKRTLIDLKKSNNSIKPYGFAQSLELKNLKKLADTLMYIAENRIFSYEHLVSKHLEIEKELELCRKSIRDIEVKISQLSAIKKQIRNIEKAIFPNNEKHCPNKRIEMQKIKKASMLYLSKHGIELPYPSSETLLEQIKVLNEQKDYLYRRYSKVKQNFDDIVKVSRNINQTVQSNLNERDF